MARSRASDLFQNFRFHLFDIPSGMNAGERVPIVLSPQAGFNSISAPSIDVDAEEIVAGNQPFPVKVAKSATCGSITLTRGVSIGDDEFYKWIMKAVYGRGNYVRDLLLVQFLSPLITQNTPMKMMEIAAYGASSMYSGLGLMSSIATIASAASRESTDSSPVFAARAWKLFNCLPTSYKSSSDFTADESGVSIAEIEFQPEYFDEYSFGTFDVDAAVDGFTDFDF